jgi:hypothetical protein
MYIGFHWSGRHPGQSRSRLLTEHWPLNLVHVRAGYTVACGCGRGTSPIEEHNSNDDGDYCYAADYTANDGSRA